ncbi:acyltransferase family protein [Flavihumibacter petaseus]|uniref:acyltransferase family protein n=1 Tax=Flavihumibacter petaseus TaxID=549295 RepID=UPI00061D0B1C|nr:acyltransferase [Flavihumibacter petaseus]
MEPGSSQKLYGLDHLRALAILLVFFFHYFILSGGQPTWLPDFASFMWTGVDLFFVLSGFLIASQLFAQVKSGEIISFRVFFGKRFFRIIPLFLVTVMFYFAFPFFRERDSLPPLWKFLTFTQNFGLNLKTGGAFSHCWSLCVEEHFYLLLPLVLLLLQVTGSFRKGKWLLLILFLLGLVFRIFSFTRLYQPLSDGPLSGIYWYKYIYYPTYNRLDGLLAGVSLAALYRFLPDTWNRIAQYGNLLLLPGIALLTGAYFLCEKQFSFAASVLGYPLIAAGYVCLVAAAVSPAGFLYRSRSRFTERIATLSYALYLTHKGVVHMMHNLLADFNINPNLMFVIALIASIGFAWILHLLVEKPMMKLRDRFIVPAAAEQLLPIPTVHKNS